MLCRADVSSRRDEKCNGASSYLNEVHPSKDNMSILSISSSNSKNYTEIQKNVVEDNSPIIQLPSKGECDRSVCTPYQHCVQKQEAKKYDDTNKVMGRRKSEEIIAMNCLATEHDNVQLNSLSTYVTICDSETHDSVREQVRDVNKHKQDLICTECGKKYRHYSSLYKHKQQVSLHHIKW